MKCTCGFERSHGSVVCRMVEGTFNRFQVEIYANNGRVMAKSPSELGVERALEFVKEVVVPEGFTAHFHWEEPSIPGIQARIATTEFAPSDLGETTLMHAAV
jgi:hypothetical protein